MRTRPMGARPRRDPSDDPTVELGNLVLDKDVIDERGRRAGKVDDILLEIDPPSAGGTIPPPELVALISGPFALSENLPRWMGKIVRWLYHLVGLDNPHPVRIPWNDIIAIDVVVHVKIDREQWRLVSLQEAVARRFIRHLPGAFVGCSEEEGQDADPVSPDRGPAHRDA